MGVTAVVEAEEAHRVLVWLRAPPRSNFGPTTGAVGRSSGGGNGGRRNGARVRSAWDGRGKGSELAVSA